ncbi:MAG: N-acetylglucosamine kinase [Candidatus Izemoplasmatales bacterium]
MKKYIIGVDGGGTKTQAALFDQNKNKVDEAFSGFCNFNVNPALSIEHVVEAIDLLLQRHDKEEIEAIILGLSGVMSFLRKHELQENLEKSYGAKVFIENDAYLGLYSVKKNQDLPTLMILAGTGSVLFTEKDGTMNMIGGYGALLGDEGSGYHLAITFLKNMISQYEGEKTIRSSSKKVLKHLGLKEYTEIKDFVYHHHKDEIAGLSKYLSTLALKDKYIQKLLKQEGLLLALQAQNALRRLGKDQVVLVGLRGSFLLNAPLVKETLIQEISKLGYPLAFDEVNLEPVFGACYIAMLQKKENTLW